MSLVLDVHGSRGGRVRPGYRTGASPSSRAYPSEDRLGPGPGWACHPSGRRAPGGLAWRFLALRLLRRGALGLLLPFGLLALARLGAGGRAGPSYTLPRPVRRRGLRRRVLQRRSVGLDRGGGPAWPSGGDGRALRQGRPHLDRRSAPAWRASRPLGLLALTTLGRLGQHVLDVRLVRGGVAEPPGCAAS